MSNPAELHQTNDATLQVSHVTSLQSKFRIFDCIFIDVYFYRLTEKIHPTSVFVILPIQGSIIAVAQYTTSKIAKTRLNELWVMDRTLLFPGGIQLE